MTTEFDVADVLRFRDVVAGKYGLYFDDSKADQLSDILKRRLGEPNTARFEAYLSSLLEPGQDETRSLAERLTVPETYFFRYLDHFRAFSEVVLPDRAAAQTGTRRLRILSAGCATGEEAYTLAILATEHLNAIPGGPWEVEILGIDLNAMVLEKARRGRFSPWSLRGTSKEMQEKFFQRIGADFVLAESIRRMVTFEERNLVDAAPTFWHRGAFDVVFCRNVTMYFTPEATRAVIGRIARSLAPGGYLFLGHAETLRGISTDFHLCHTHETFYYQARPAGVPVPPPRAGTPNTTFAPSGAGNSPERGPDLAASSQESETWVDAIQSSSNRIQALVAPASGPKRDPQGEVPVQKGADERRAASPSRNVLPALELLREERFNEALESLGALGPEAAADLDVQLLRGVLFTNSGRLEDAERLCKTLLAADELSAGAHHLMALCREHARDLGAAVDHDQAAVYLDPTFAMPRLHLGLMAKRAGNPEMARRELHQAEILLSGEDASRILLFGGGFSRETLLNLCRAELRACESGR